ncbi:MAG: class I SAM-dependent methyltransferase [Chthoniobacterales bacterium]|nr:class I SAM-dependent methyltransferase [Chthoniobacterales bacterium]
MTSKPLVETIQKLRFQGNEEELLAHLCSNAGAINIDGRNIFAGYARGGGLIFGKLFESLKADPIYQESRLLAGNESHISLDCLANIFLIMKYGVKNLSGAIIEFGSYRGGTALFMANTARRLELPVMIYALDTFEGIPEEDERLDFYRKGALDNADLEQFLERKKKAKLDCLIPIKGTFQKTMPLLLPKIKTIALAHIDSLAYASTKYALTAIEPLMHPAGGYIIIDHATRVASSLGAFQAVEEMTQKQRLHAEQTVPHFVYRMPKL